MLIPEVPKVLSNSKMQQFLYGKEFSDSKIPIGIDFDHVETVFVDLLSTGIFGIMGQDDEQRLAVLDYFMNYVKEKMQAKIYMIDGIDRKLQGYQQEYEDIQYSFHPEDVSDMTDDMLEMLEDRKAAMYENPDALAEEPYLILILENPDLFEFFEESRVALGRIRNMVQNLKRYKVFIVFSNVPNIVLGYNSFEVFKFIRQEMSLLMFENLNQSKFYEIPTKVIKEHALPLQGQDGYYIKDGELNKLKVVYDEKE